jgi:hypothetical protein
LLANSDWSITPGCRIPSATASMMIDGQPQPLRRASSRSNSAGAPYSAAKNTTANSSAPGRPVLSS